MFPQTNAGQPPAGPTTPKNTLWQRLLPYRWWLLAAGAGLLVVIIWAIFVFAAHRQATDSTTGTGQPQQTSQDISNTNKTAPKTDQPAPTTTKPGTPPVASTPKSNSTAPSTSSSSGSTGSSNNSGNSTPAPFWPGASNTGVPAGLALHACPATITVTGTYDACQFSSGVAIRANNVHITRSLIQGQVDAQSGDPGQQTGLVISDSSIDCGCQSQDDTHTPSAISDSNFTLLRVNIFNAGHGAAVASNVVIQDSWIHGLGGNTEAHKDGIYSGNGTNVTLKHNNIECNDGPLAGCTSAIGLLTDFSDITYYTIDNNLLNTIGSYCFYAAGGPGKSFVSNHITFTNNHFGRSISANCGQNGPVSYWDATEPGMVWSGNVWDDTGQTVDPVY